MRFANLPKAFGRARRLPLRRLLDTGARRGWAAARGVVQVWEADRLGLRDDGLLALHRAVRGVRGAVDATACIEAFVGRLPVSRVELAALPVRTVFPAETDTLLARADQACAGYWTILGFPPAALGVRPDWQADFVHGVRWDEALSSARQPIVRREATADIKVPWEVSRLQHLPAVAHAFVLTKERRYIDLVVAQLSDWIAKNPPGLGVNWTNAMEVALRAISISWAFELCRVDPAFPADLKARAYWSLFAHGHFIRGHLEDGGVAIGNHYIADLVGLLWLGSLYPTLRGFARWRDAATGLLADQLGPQVRADGGDEESSIAYHRLVAELLALACAITAANGREVPLFRESLRRMARFTRGVVKPDGNAPQLGDNDGGRVIQLLSGAPLDHRGLVSWAALLTEDPGLAAAVPLSLETALLVGPTAIPRHAKLAAMAGEPRSDSADGVVRSQRPSSVEGERANLTIFPDSGLAIFRRSELYCLCAAAPVGQEGAGGHGHNDKLAFELWLGGDVVIDPGSYAYTSDPAARNAFRSTAAHATVQIDDREQNPISGDLFSLPERSRAIVLRCEEVGLDGFVWEAEHRGFAPFVHRRVLQLTGNVLTLTDELTSERPGLRRKAHQVAARFPCAPDLRVELADRVGVVWRGERRILELVSVGPDELRWSVEEGWYSPNYGTRVPSSVLIARVSHQLPVILRIELRLLGAGA